MRRRRLQVTSGAADDSSRGAGTWARRGHAVGTPSRLSPAAAVVTSPVLGCRGDPAAGLSPSPALWAGGTFLQHGAPRQHQPWVWRNRGLLRHLGTAWELREQQTPLPPQPSL